MARPSVIQTVRELGALAEPDRIARHLFLQGVSGRRETAAGCPVANYVRDVTGNDAVRVGARHIRFRVGRSPVSVPTPGPIARFVQAFDRGEYPALDSAVVGGPPAPPPTTPPTALDGALLAHR